MFRSDRDALAQEIEDLRRERQELRAQNDAMHRDLLTRRQQAPVAVGAPSVYKQGIAHLTPGERVALAHHEVEAFPVWASVLLCFVTLGLFPLIHLSRLHDRLPRAESDDPTTGRAIGFTFIPYFQVYWIIFNSARLASRLNLQFRLRGLPDRVPRGLVVTTAVLSVIPYVGFLAAPLLWPITVAFLQRAANALAALPRDGADAVAGAEALAWQAEASQPPRPRIQVPLVPDLPVPADAAEQEAEMEADEAPRPRSATR